MHTYHLLVAKSPVYLLGLETIISRNVSGSEIVICRNSHDIRMKTSDSKHGILWWALPVDTHSQDVHFLFNLVTDYPRLQVIVMQHKFEPATVRALYDNGVSGILSDLCSAEEIREAIISASNGQRYLDHSVSNLLSARYLDALKARGEHPEPLTEREREVLSLIISEHTTREIAEKLYISKCTVETHRLHMIRKLKVKNTAGLVREALSHSLCEILR